jgi:hypothetical protein
VARRLTERDIPSFLREDSEELDNRREYRRHQFTTGANGKKELICGRPFWRPGDVQIENVGVGCKKEGPCELTTVMTDIITFRRDGEVWRIIDFFWQK